MNALHKKTVILTLCLSFAVFSIVNTSFCNAKTNVVTFSANFGWLSGNLGSTIDMPSGVVAAGEDKKIECALTADKMNLTINVPNIGSSSIQVDALGHQDYPLPGLQYNVPLLGNVGLFLSFEGIIEGKLQTTGNTTLSTNYLIWSSANTQSASITIPQDAVEGTSITVELSNITYSITAGVKAQGDIAGQHIEQTIIDNILLGDIVASPSSVSTTFDVQTSSVIDTALWVGSIVTSGLCISTGVLLFAKKRKLKNVNAKLTSSPLPVNASPKNVICQNCGAANSNTAKFCKGCGKKLS